MEEGLATLCLASATGTKVLGSVNASIARKARNCLERTKSIATFFEKVSNLILRSFDFAELSPATPLALTIGSPSFVATDFRDWLINNQEDIATWYSSSVIQLVKCSNGSYIGV
jgi:stalled ribosome rescue protein Dom34